VKEYPYWWDSLPSAESQKLKVKSQGEQAANLPARADVVVIGAGYTGLAAARRLARVGAVVVVVEREQVGWGASSRNGGQVLTGMKLDASTLVARFGETRARELFDIATDSIVGLESLIDEEAIDCGYARVGHLQAAFKASHFEAFREEQALLARVFDHEVRVLPRSEQRGEIGSDAYHGVLVDERSGGLNPAQYVRGLAAAATRAGATIVTGIGVTSLERKPAAWRVRTTGGDIEAQDLLVATNGYSGAAVPVLQRRFLPIGSYIIATERLDERVASALLPRCRMAFDSKHFLFYFRITNDRRLLFGGRAEFGRPDEHTTRRAASILRKGMDTVFPELSGVAIDYAWGGNVAFTRDQMPRAGRLDALNYAGGYCGHGVAMATYLGEQIARRIGGELIENPLFDDRFPAIPMYSGNPWFLPLVGAYYQVKDWLT
jgi:glycine/D-amino acid oxidase-like deaminating enzyme